MLITIDGEDKKDDGEGEGNGLQQVEACVESGLLRNFLNFWFVFFVFPACTFNCKICLYYHKAFVTFVEVDILCWLLDANNIFKLRSNTEGKLMCSIFHEVVVL